MPSERFAPTGEAGPGFGYSVALSADGSTALISAGVESVGWVFVRSGSSWAPEGTLAGGKDFGSSVALSGNGDPSAHGDAEDKGSVWVFTCSGSTWTEQKKFTGSGTANIYELAPGAIAHVSADGDVALVSGARERTFNNRRSDPVWIFRRSGSTWSQGEKLVGGEGDFGASVALSGEGDTALVGEPVAQLQEPIVCLGAFEPLCPPTFHDQERSAPRAHKAATTNPAEGHGRVWVFQEASNWGCRTGRSSDQEAPRKRMQERRQAKAQAPEGYENQGPYSDRRSCQAVSTGRGSG